MDAALSPVIGHTALVAEWEQLKQKLRSAAKRRNAVVHGRWGYTAAAPGALVERARKALWKEADFQDVLVALHATYTAIRTFRGKIIEAKLQGEVQN